MTKNVELALKKLGRHEEDTKTYQVLLWLVDHPETGLTQLEATSRFYATRLSSMVHRFRNEFGLEVKSEPETKGRSHFTRYKLIG